MAGATAPVDPTTTAAWSQLASIADGFTPDLRAWFADDPGRVERLTLTAADLHVDLSKNLLDDDVLAALLALADEVGSDRASRRDVRRRRTSTSPRTGRCCTPRCAARPASSLEVDGQDVVADVHEVLERVYAFAEQVRSGAWTGVTGRAHRRRWSTSASAGPTWVR